MFTKSGLFTILKVTKSGFDCTLIRGLETCIIGCHIIASNKVVFLFVKDLCCDSCGPHSIDNTQKKKDIEKADRLGCNYCNEKQHC